MPSAALATTPLRQAAAPGPDASRRATLASMRDDRNLPLFPPGSPHDTSLERELGYATFVCALAVAAGMAAERWLAFDDLSLVFMTAVVFVSARSRMGVSVLAAVACFLAYNFFFLEPRYTFYLSARDSLVTVLMFLVGALVCGRLANRLRAQVIALKSARAQAEALERLGRRLTAAGTEAEAISATTAALGEALETEAVVLPRDPVQARLVEHGSEGRKPRFDPSLDAAAARCLARSAEGDDPPEERGERDVSWHCLAMGAPPHATGVVALRLPAPLVSLPPGQARLAEAMVRDLAQALARLQLGRQLEATRLQAEAERLRAALLSSVSHDLRSPLSTIIGSAESLDLYREQLSVEDQRLLARDILGEGRRLDRYIQNLLDMTRLGHGAPALEREWIGLDDILGTAMQRVLRVHPGRTITTQLPAVAPLLHVNPPLFEQALFNVLDNAAKFSPMDRPIHVRAGTGDGRVEIDVLDEGPGIPETEREPVFDMFHSVSRGDRRPEGTGLGLTICRGILRAHGGDASALAGHDGRGTALRLWLPLPDAPSDLPKDD
jgi:two-component system sensor histidine kinase KdpD